ncbi:MAG TPA: RNA polymerase sigma factor [Ktedonobacteraceae bacterium]|nr:RNA polymerase sigma factor [Ktedonobacteraceae bacterium]
MAVSDGQLSMQLAADLNRYFSQLVLTYQHRLYAFALRQSGSLQDAEDIAQEAFIRAYYALGDYPPERIRLIKLQPWLYKITLNVFYERLRHARLQLVPLDITEDSLHLDIEDDWREQPDVVLENREGIRELETLVHTLPAQYREAISLFYFEDLSYREIAELLNCPIGTVKSTLHRGTKLLRKTLETQKRETHGAV